MAHATKIQQLVNDLYHSIASERGNQESPKRRREQAAKALRNSGHARTNQFDVKSKLEGLVEKFSVLNRDDLSNALQTRLDELPAESKWLPEVLALLLQLSDRPLVKTRLEDVEALARPREDEQSALTWDDILAEDPFDEAGVWDDVERGYHSSGDEKKVEDEDDSQVSVSTTATSVGEDDVVALAWLHVLQPHQTVLDEIRVANRCLSGTNPDSPTSELTLVRESISMLHGLPTNVYSTSSSTGQVSLSEGLNLENAVKSTVHDFLSQLAGVGTWLNRLRRWAREELPMTYQQSCQASVRDLLMKFGSELAMIEQRYLPPAVDVVVSIVDLRNDVERCAKPLLHLSRIVSVLDDRTDSEPFALLDVLYDEVCVAELSGNIEDFRISAGVLHAGLKTYLRPISTWIQNGTINANGEAFLVEEINSNCDLGNFWQDRYAIRTLSSGRLCIPKCMDSFVTKIFRIGKSRSFLEALEADGGTKAHNARYHGPDFAAIEQQITTNQLVPYSQRLNDALESWITEIGKDCTPLLKTELLKECGLLRSIDGLQQAFCAHNGCLFQTFADVLFWRMDHSPSGWKNEFLMTELAQSTLGSALTVDAESLSVRFEANGDGTPTQASIRQMENIHLEYVFPWQIQNVTRSHSSSTYSKALTLQLQVYRMKYLLRRQLFDLRLLSCRMQHLPRDFKKALRLRQSLLATVDILHDHITSTSQIAAKSLRLELEAAYDIDAMADVWSAHEKELGTTLLLANNMKPIRESILGCLPLCERLARRWNHLVRPDYDARDHQDGYGQGHSAGGESRDQSIDHASFSTLHDEFSRSLSFVITGVRSLSRVVGNPALEALAERLADINP